MSLLALTLGALIGFGQHGATAANRPDPTDTGLSQKWVEYLQSVQKAEATAMVMDVDLDAQVPYIAYPYKKGGRRAMAMLADASRRAYQQTNGVQVLTISPRPKAYEPRAFGTAFERFVDDLTPAEVQHAMREGLPFSALSPALQDQVLEVTAQDRLLPNEIRTNPGTTRVRFELDAMLATTDPKTGKKRYVSIPVRIKENKNEATGAPASPESVIPLDPAAGPLDFGDGSVISFGAFVKRGADSFKKRYEYDPRLAPTTVYAGGKMTRDGFEAAFKLLATTVPPKISENNASAERARVDALLSGRLAQLLDGPLEDQLGLGLDSQDLAGRKQTTVGELSRGSDQALKYFESQGLGANSQVELVPGILWVVELPGERLLPPSLWSQPGIEEYELNRFRSGIR